MVKTELKGRVDGDEFVLVNEERFSMKPVGEEKSEYETKKSILDATINNMKNQVKGSRIFTLETDKDILREASSQMKLAVPTQTDWDKFQVMQAALGIKNQQKQLPITAAKLQIKDTKENIEHMKRTAQAMVIK